MPDLPDGQTQPGNDQMDYKAKYVELSAQIASGDYVPKTVYTGLQQTHEKTILAHRADKDTLASLQTQLTNKDTVLQGVSTQMTELTTKLEGSTKELEISRQKNERTTLIMGKFPQLSNFEADGLLPQAAAGDDLEKLLTSFSEKLGVLKKTSQQTVMAGASDPPSGKDAVSTPTTKQLLDEMNELSRAGKWKEYNDAYAKYLASLPVDK